MILAQSDTSTLEEIDVVTEYKPDVAEIRKVDIQPSLEEPKVSPPSYSYSFPNISYQPKPVYSPIDPVFVKPEKDQDYFDNYIEVGGGNYLTSYIDASVHNTKDMYHTYGLRVRHHASSASKNPNQATFSTNRITAFGLREKGTDLLGEIDYQRNVIHYYGYLPDTTERPLKDIEQKYNDINARALWTVKKRKLDNAFSVGFNIFDNVGENESSFKASNELSFKVGKDQMHVDLQVLYTQLTERLKYNRLFIDVNPHFEFNYQKYHIDLGIMATYFLDSNTNQIFPAPFVHAETYLVPDKLRAYLGIDGGLTPNTMKSLTYENLFLGLNQQFNNPYTKVNLFAGMNGSFKRFVEYGIEMSQAFISNQYFFVNDTNELRNFQTVYDDMSRFSFMGELKFDINQNLDIGFRGKFYSYSLNKENDAWHLPTYDVGIFSTIRIADKIYLNGGYFGTSARRSRDLSGQTYLLDAIHDINLGAEYRYKKNISGFIHVNNLLNKRYELFKHYRSQGLNVLAGVTFSL